MIDNPKISMSLNPEFIKKKMASPAFNNLSPRLKELLNENKDLLRKILINDNAKLNQIIQQQRRNNKCTTEKMSRVLRDAVRNRSKPSIPKEIRQELQNPEKPLTEELPEDEGTSSHQKGLSFRNNQQNASEDEQISFAENLGYHFEINAIDYDKCGTETVKMKKFLKGYEQYIIDEDAEEEKLEETVEEQTKMNSSMMYSEFEQAIVDLKDLGYIQADLTDFLIRNITSFERQDLAVKTNKSTFAQSEEKIDRPDLDTSGVLSASKIMSDQIKSRTSILKVEERGELMVIDDSSSLEMEMMEIEEIAQACSQLDY